MIHKMGDFSLWTSDTLYEVSKKDQTQKIFRSHLRSPSDSFLFSPYLVGPCGNVEGRLLPLHLLPQLQALAFHPQPELGGLTACRLTHPSLAVVSGKEQGSDPHRLPHCDCLRLCGVSISCQHPRLELCKHLLPGRHADGVEGGVDARHHQPLWHRPGAAPGVYCAPSLSLPVGP